MPGPRSIAQSHRGPLGHKQVWWRRESAQPVDQGQVSVWLDDVPSQDTAVLQTAALVAEGYCLFLLGPLWLVDRDLPMRLGGTEPVDGRPCDIVDVWLSPGLGLVQTDRLSIWIDRSDHVMRRVRFTLEGFEGTQGAVAEVETYDHVQRFGVLWPTRFYERLKHPLPLPVHDWKLTGLDVDRGYGPQSLSGPRFSGTASADAAPFT